MWQMSLYGEPNNNSTDDQTNDPNDDTNGGSSECMGATVIVDQRSNMDFNYNLGQSTPLTIDGLYPYIDGSTSSPGTTCEIVTELYVQLYGFETKWEGSNMPFIAQTSGLKYEGR
jgi:hypothetical protein